METTGQQKWEQLRKKLHSRRTVDNRVGVEEMNLDQLLEIQQKFLAWYPTTTHPDKELKKHIHDTYIQPRIEKLIAHGNP